MNMMMIKKNSEEAQSDGVSTVFNPAVRLVNAMNVVDWSLSKKLRPSSVLLHSVSMNATMLTKMMMKVQKVAMRVWSEILRNWRFLKSIAYCSSVMARKPNPPASARMQVVKFMTGFSWNCTSESGNSVNPTLQNELTAWNTEQKMRSYISMLLNCVK